MSFSVCIYVTVYICVCKLLCLCAITNILYINTNCIKWDSKSKSSFSHISLIEIICFHVSLNSEQNCWEVKNWEFFFCSVLFLVCFVYFRLYDVWLMVTWSIPMWKFFLFSKKSWAVFFIWCLCVLFSYYTFEDRNGVDDIVNISYRIDQVTINWKHNVQQMVFVPWADSILSMSFIFD